MKKAITMLICLIFLGGCQQFKVWTYTPHDLSVTEDHKTYVFYIAPKTNENTPLTTEQELLAKQLSFLAKPEGSFQAKSQKAEGRPIKKYEDLIKELEKIIPNIRNYIENSNDKSAFAAVSILAASGKLLFGLVMDASSSKAQDIIESSEYPYNNTTFITAEKFRRCETIIIIRESKLRVSEESDKKKEDKRSVGMIAILKLNKITSDGKEAKKQEQSEQPEPPYVACYLTPVFIYMNNSAAQTVSSNPSLKISFAIAVKGIVDNQYKYRELGLLGLAALTVEGLNLNDVKNDAGSIADAGSLEGIESDLIPLPNNDKPILLSVSISVVEKGIVGFGLERTNAEISAIKDAIGGGISDMITERFD